MSRVLFNVGDIVTLYDNNNNGYITPYTNDRNENIYKNVSGNKIGSKYKVTKQITDKSLWKVRLNIPSGKYFFQNTYNNQYICNRLIYKYEYAGGIYENKFHITTIFTSHCLFDILTDNSIQNEASVYLPHIEMKHSIPNIIQYLRNRESGTMRTRVRQSKKGATRSSSNKSPRTSSKSS